VEHEHVLVVGAGQMGGGIAQVIAASGRRVSLHDPFPGAVERGLAAIEKSLTRLGADVADVTTRITPVVELVEGDQLI
jgi:3-hydroxybutyryl-CoA dehydrogenase